jgi:tartrate dehydratase beta subunit/fumarate hydratase class I family protein
VSKHQATLLYVQQPNQCVETCCRCSTRGTGLLLDRVLNHASGDPQHPHNQLLFLLGLTLTKVPVAGYPDLGGTFGAKLHVHQNDTLPLHVRGVATASGYDKFTRKVLLQHVAIHAVGVGGMSHGQGIKCEYFKRIGFWEIGASCSN